MRATLSLFAVWSLVVSTVLTLSFAANATEREPKPDNRALPPATRYSGSTPIDLSNGLLFNNGTYGTRNDDYEAWARSATIVAGLSERTYSYAQRLQFNTIMAEQVTWGEAAIANWKNTTNEFPDALAYSKMAVEKMSPYFDKLKSAASSADGANEGKWASAESDARRALIDFRIAYMQMHNNVQARSMK